MSKRFAGTTKYGNCRCVELPVSNDGVVAALMRVQFPDAHFVSKCPHKEIGYAVVVGEVRVKRHDRQQPESQ